MRGNKIILENLTDLPMADFLRLAENVVRQGRISGKRYCGLSVITIDNEEYHIVSDINAKSDKLTMYKAAKWEK